MDGLLQGLLASPGVLHGELARLAHWLEWVSSGIDIASIAIMLVGSLRFNVGKLVPRSVQPFQVR